MKLSKEQELKVLKHLKPYEITELKYLFNDWCEASAFKVESDNYDSVFYDWLRGSEDLYYCILSDKGSLYFSQDDLRELLNIEEL